MTGEAQQEKPRPPELAPLDRYWVVLSAYSVAVFVAMLTFLIQFVYFLFFVPVAVYAARGELMRAAGLVAAAVAAAVVASRGVAASGLAAGALIATGIPIGLGLAYRKSYGRVVAVATAYGLVILILTAVAGREEWSEFRAEFTGRAETTLAQLKSDGANEMQIRRAELALWTAGNMLYLGFGLLCIVTLVSIGAAVTITGRWLRRSDEAFEIRGRFSTMRPPDWLAWVAIAAFGLWYADSQWPSETLRVVSWNSGVALAGIYWLNGLSIIVYALSAWKPHLIIYVPVLFAVFYVPYFPIFMGLFDTWGEFRNRIDAVIAAKKENEESDSAP